jgi:hypothetical protein
LALIVIISDLRTIGSLAYKYLMQHKSEKIMIKMTRNPIPPKIISDDKLSLSMLMNLLAA